jgi:outer membrane protein assembly factor BamB
MKILKNTKFPTSLKRGKTSTIALILLLAISSFGFAISTAEAHFPAWNIVTHAYVAPSPSTVGVGEYTQLVMWLDWVPPTAGGDGGDRWRGFMLAVTKPDGTKTTLGPFTTSPVGSTYTTFTPDQAGTYSFVLSFPGQVLTNGTGVPNFRGAAYVNDTFLPSTSVPALLTVTQNATVQWQEPPIPTGYWTRPISDANRAWSSLASNWLLGSWLVGNWQTAGKAPNSPHILWQKLLTAGGIGDAQWPGQPYDIDDYESPWSSPIVMNGRIYYNTPPTASNARYGYYCLDLYTGQQIWYKNGTDNGLNNPFTLVGFASGANSAPALQQSYPTLSFGQMQHYNSLNGQGVISYLWITIGSSWYMLDSDNGNWIMTLKNVPGGTAVTDQDGNLLRYSYNANTGNLLCWNSSQSIPPSGPTGTGQQIWKPRVGATIDAVNDNSWTLYGPVANQWDASDITPRSGYTMNVTIPTGLPGITRVLQDANRVPKIIMGFTIDPPIATSGLSDPTTTFRVWAAKINEHAAPYSPNPTKTETQNNNLGFTVTMLYDRNFTNPMPGTALSLGAVSYLDDIFTVDSKEGVVKWGYSLSTGSLAWGPTAPQGAWDLYGVSDTAAYGKIYSGSYGGVIYAYEAKTGKLLWNYTLSNVGFESPYGNFPVSIGAIVDGKLILYSTEHSPTKPLWRGSNVRAIDANTGKELWTLLDFNMGLAVADGYIVSGDKYDNTIVCIGIGPSATTVSTQDFAAPKGTPVLIQGTVTDQSPGAKGTPAIADAYQKQWMEFLYKQQSCPTTATGVPVKLTAIDPNGNTQDIGTVTSDINGLYKKSWTPPVEGAYTIIATFAGTASYGNSYAETALLVGPAQAAPVVSSTPTQTIAPTSTPAVTTSASPSSAVSPPGSGMPIATYAAIGAVVIIVVAIAAALVLRRRK